MSFFLCVRQVGHQPIAVHARDLYLKISGQFLVNLTQEQQGQEQQVGYDKLTTDLSTEIVDSCFIVRPAISSGHDSSLALSFVQSAGPIEKYQTDVRPWLSSPKKIPTVCSMPRWAG